MKDLFIFKSIAASVIVFGLSITYQIGYNLGYFPLNSIIMAISVLGIISPLVTIPLALMFSKFNKLIDANRRDLLTLNQSLLKYEYLLPTVDEQDLFGKKPKMGIVSIVAISSDEWDKFDRLMASCIAKQKADANDLNSIATLLRVGITLGKEIIADTLLGPLDRYKFGDYDPGYAYNAASFILGYNPSDPVVESNPTREAGHCLVRCTIMYLQPTLQSMKNESNNPEAQTTLATVEDFLVNAVSTHPEQTVSYLCKCMLGRKEYGKYEPLQECYNTLQPIMKTSMEDQIMITVLSSFIQRRKEHQPSRKKEYSPKTSKHTESA